MTATQCHAEREEKYTLQEQADTQTDDGRWTDEATDRQTDRQTEAETETETGTETTASPAKAAREDGGMLRRDCRHNNGAILTHTHTHKTHTHTQARRGIQKGKHSAATNDGRRTAAQSYAAPPAPMYARLSALHALGLAPRSTTDRPRFLPWPWPCPCSCCPCCCCCR